WLIHKSTTDDKDFLAVWPTLAAFTLPPAPTAFHSSSHMSPSRPSKSTDRLCLLPPLLRNITASPSFLIPHVQKKIQHGLLILSQSHVLLQKVSAMEIELYSRT
ncbi:hypothetical protein L2E82_34407, partial [Cichorium intybus]